MGMGGGGSHLKLGFVTGSLDGKPVAPLLPTRPEWTHTSGGPRPGFRRGICRPTTTMWRWCGSRRGRWI